MEPQSINAEYVIGQMRVQTMREEPFFYVITPPTKMADLDTQLDILIPKLEAAQTEAHTAEGAVVVIRYYYIEAPDIYLMEVGVPVKEGTLPAGEAQVKTLPEYRCASLLYSGSLAHIGEAYGALMQAIQDAGFERSTEGREWYYHFEGDSSPNNVIGLYLGIQ